MHVYQVPSKAKDQKGRNSTNKERRTLDQNGIRLEVLSRSRRMIRVVCRDSIALLAPPTAMNTNTSTTTSGNLKNVVPVNVVKSCEHVNLLLDKTSDDDTKDETDAVESRVKTKNSKPRTVDAKGPQGSTDFKGSKEVQKEAQKEVQKEVQKEAIESQERSVSHPALLAPLLATQDSCLKILSILTELLTTGGCALLLKGTYDPSDVRGASVNVTYQAICTGNALSWYGLTPGVFGNVTIENTSLKTHSAHTPHTPHTQHTPHTPHIPHAPISLVESCVLSGRTLDLPDGTADPRYSPVVDGSCLSESPYMVTPVRGREGAIVGVLVAARRRGAAAYTQVSRERRRLK